MEHLGAADRGRNHQGGMRGDDRPAASASAAAAATKFLIWTSYTKAARLLPELKPRRGPTSVKKEQASLAVLPMARNTPLRIFQTNSFSAKEPTRDRKRGVSVDFTQRQTWSFRAARVSADFARARVSEFLTPEPGARRVPLILSGLGVGFFYRSVGAGHSHGPPAIVF